MELASHTAKNERIVSDSAHVTNIIAGLTILIVTAALFGALFNRETVFSYAIGYNLYGAERVLEGDVPYRDFHTLYPPGTVYLNAWLFKLLGVSLYTALVGVLCFKVLTTLLLFLCARAVMPLWWAVAAASSSLIWLRPNGPFKAVPMHYGALFLVLALFFLLKEVSAGGKVYSVGAGVAAGLLTLFKHNIGAVALVGLLVTVVLSNDSGRLGLKSIADNGRRLLLILGGFLTPLVPVFIYMLMAGVLGAMVKTLMFGPGEFLVSRLSGLPSPVVPLLLALWLLFLGYITRRLDSRPRLTLTIVGLLLVAVFLLWATQRLVDPVIFYLPAGAISAGVLFTIFGRLTVRQRTTLVALIAVAVAAYVESFPRFAREQIVSAMPFAFLLLLYTAYLLTIGDERIVGTHREVKLLLAFLPIAVLLIGGRLFFNTYLGDEFSFKSNTPLRTERGRGVYFPPATANEIDEAVDYIQAKVPPDGYFFAHSYAASSLLFLSDRNNPSAAQFWGGVGVTDEERRKTMEALMVRDVKLAVTSDRDLAAEKYTPLLEFLERDWRLAKRVGDTLILEKH